MPITLTIILIIAVVITLLSLRIVEQNTVAVVEFLGKYRRTLSAGLNILVPLFERIRERVTLRQQNFVAAGHYPSKDKVIVTVSTNLIFVVNGAEDASAVLSDGIRTDEGIKRYVYSLENRGQSIAASIENSLRTYIAKETHEGILEKKKNWLNTSKQISHDSLKSGEWLSKVFRLLKLHFLSSLVMRCHR
jgi:regulator of protease activity HflC (stomatin/prohibitin superfamily)